MKIVIFAANGYIGRVLVDYYTRKNAEVIAVTRKPSLFPSGVTNVLWDGKTYEDSWANHLNEAELVINLAGKSVNCRYTEQNKKEIFDSRTFATEVIAKAISQCAIPPKLWVNSASATIYRHAEDRPMDELTGEIGSGFSVEVCKKWERTFFESQTPATRKVALRMAIVLGNSEGVFLRLKNLVRFGLGGKQGNGKQMFSWIHDQDLCRIFDFLLENETLEGVYNAASPNPISNEKIMTTIRRQMQMPFGLPSPAWLLEMGALLIGTETELIFKSRWVVPTKLIQAGFRFQFPTIEEAVNDILN
jgi:uncharacterized protein (TIGR01777 family)